jgi:RNA polymerase sigma factor (sigma-70 family)
MRINKPAIATLLEQHQRLIFARAASFHRTTGVDYDDLVAEGYLTFCLAYRKFNPDRGVRFSTFLYHCLNTRLYNYVRDVYRAKVDTVELHPNIASCTQGELTIKLASLSKEALYAVDVLLYGPVKVLQLTGTESIVRIRTALKLHLRGQGWKRREIIRVFREIQRIMQ